MVAIGTFEGEGVLLEDSDEAREFYAKSRYGSIARKGRVRLSFLEACHLAEQGKIAVKDGRGRTLDIEQLLRKGKRVQADFATRYAVFSDLRSRGYIVKTALKFGADFRVYDKGVKPGEDHARWIVYPVHESAKHTWHEFSAKNRVAHSTRKRLLIAVADDEGDVSYWEVSWLRP